MVYPYLEQVESRENRHRIRGVNNGAGASGSSLLILFSQ